MTVIVLAKIELHPGTRERFLEAFHRLVPQVRAEVGCLEYGPTIDLPTTHPRQTKLGENVVLIVEKWTSFEALQAHFVAPHMGPYREQVKDFVISSTLNYLQEA
jgi:quinol monooxygenase YgiN